MSQHTQTPWHFDPDNLNVYADGLLAQVYGHFHSGERKANARLIAAAPELLAALQGVMSLIESGQLQRNIDDDGKPDFALRMLEFVPKIKAGFDAIAKAEGVKND